MAAQVGALPAGALASEALRHPSFDPLRPWLSKLGEHPTVDDLNAFMDAAPVAPRTASGQTVRFCAPAPGADGHYDQKIFDTGVVDTRPDNLHDLFNALAWLAFPHTKAAINARHVECIAVEGTTRGPLRDLLTLVDEGGVIVACADESLGEVEKLVREFRWQELFWERRLQLLADTRFVLVGHNAYEKALAPYPGITCKALFVAAPRSCLESTGRDLVGLLDARAAEWITGLPEAASPRQMAPLPVFGYPGWLPQGVDAAFYQDRRWFRPAPSRRPKADKLERPV